ncbi:hypothetical protein PSTT_12863 [Puccinia striiformis]|uniref:Dilute domain-containing protein n=1 Tax=Puccinia striiformis TaxID=27350 RepID=A0A2S4UU82_9BASI|nr:hypothetical protein PSTT_12863 [Puccinia striiformis]
MTVPNHQTSAFSSHARLWVYPKLVMDDTPKDTQCEFPEPKGPDLELLTNDDDDDDDDEQQQQQQEQQQEWNAESRPRVHRPTHSTGTNNNQPIETSGKPTATPLIRQMATLIKQQQLFTTRNTSYCIQYPQPGQARQWIDLEARDEDGSPAIILAATFGHAEAVRAIVDGLGDQWLIGGMLLDELLPTDRPSNSTLTPTHPQHSRLSSCSNSNYAASEAPSLLLPTDDESNSTTTNPRRRKRRRRRARGLRPYDLAKKDEQGETIREILRIAEQAQLLATEHPHSRRDSQASVRSMRRAEIQSEAERLNQNQRKSFQLARLCSKTLEIDPLLLGLEPEPTKKSTLDTQPNWFFSDPHHHHHHTHEQATIIGLAASFRTEWEQEQSGRRTRGRLEAVIETIEPRQLRSDRSVPANVLFFCARFAAHMGTVELLEEARQENMANSTFWLFNAICLLYYIRREPTLNEQTKEEIQIHLEDLVNEIYVFIIRDAERRLDKLIDCTILDYESLPELMVGIEFEPEGSWRFVRALTAKRNRTTSFKPSVPRFNTFRLDGQTPNNSPNNSLNSTPIGKSSSGVGHGPRTTSAPNQSSLSPSPSQQHQLLRSPPTATRTTTGKTPKLITDLLSSNYLEEEIYLCRSKAYQIHLNVRVIEDWAILNRLPMGLIKKHFEPLNQLLNWIQSLSSTSPTNPPTGGKRNSNNESFDTLIEIVSSLNKTLNPAQLLKVSRDYRFELDEPKLSEECREYLIQTQQDWDRRRIQRVMELEEADQLALQQLRSSLDPTSPTLNNETLPTISSPQLSPSPVENIGLTKAIKAIDAAFGTDDLELYRSYEPPIAPECLGELLDSRQMLPFGLPSSNLVLMSSSLKLHVPFGCFKTYCIPDDPKPGSHWWSSTTCKTSDGEEEEDEDDDEEEEDAEDYGEEYGEAYGQEEEDNDNYNDDDDDDDDEEGGVKLNGEIYYSYKDGPSISEAEEEPTTTLNSRKKTDETPRLKDKLDLNKTPDTTPISTVPSRPQLRIEVHTTPTSSTNQCHASSVSNSNSCRLDGKGRGLVPIVPSTVLKRIDRYLFKINTSSS